MEFGIRKFKWRSFASGECLENTIFVGGYLEDLVESTFQISHVFGRIEYLFCNDGPMVDLHDSIQVLLVVLIIFILQWLLKV